MADCKLTPQRRRCDYEFTPQLIRKYDERGRTGQITLSIHESLSTENTTDLRFLFVPSSRADEHPQSSDG
jgi:hypothetical protein